MAVITFTMTNTCCRTDVSVKLNFTIEFQEKLQLSAAQNVPIEAVQRFRWTTTNYNKSFGAPCVCVAVTVWENKLFFDILYLLKTYFGLIKRSDLKFPSLYSEREHDFKLTVLGSLTCQKVGKNVDACLWVISQMPSFLGYQYLYIFTVERLKLQGTAQFEVKQGL